MCGGPMATTLRIMIIATAAIALTTAGFVAVDEAHATNASRPRRDAGARYAVVPPAPAGSIVLQAKPSQKPKPAQNPKSTPAPVVTPRPTPKPTPKPTARPTRAPARATPAPTARPTAGRAAKATSRPKPTPVVGAIVPPSQSTMAGATLTSESALPPGGGVPLAPFLLLPGLLALLVVVAIVRRRRPEEIAAPAASADGVATTQLDDLTTAVTSSAVPAGEADVPRWRRPSLVAARFETDNTVIQRAATVDRSAGRHAPSVFTDRTTDAGERMRLRYDAVPLLDRPDDVLARTQAELNAGDEVLVLERGEIWASVTTPAGVMGWVPSMVLMEESAMVDEGGSGIANDPATIEPTAEPPSLEMLLEAAAARRLAREEHLQTIRSAQPDPVDPMTERLRREGRKPADTQSKRRSPRSGGTRSRARGA